MLQPGKRYCPFHRRWFPFPRQRRAAVTAESTAARCDLFSVVSPTDVHYKTHQTHQENVIPMVTMKESLAALALV